MEKALNLRLFTILCDYPQWRSGYVKADQPEGTGLQILLGSFFFPFFFFFFVCLFVLLFFVFKYIPK